MVKDQLTTLSKLALLLWLQIYNDNKEIEGHLQILRWMYILVVTFMALINAGFILNLLEKCHYFTLTESLVVEQKS